MNTKTIRLRSCFIIDIEIHNEYIKITDSAKNIYKIRTDNDVLMNEYKQWLSNVFMQGVAQTLTIISYHIEDISECEVEYVVDKIFLNQKTRATQIISNNVN